MPLLQDHLISPLGALGLLLLTKWLILELDCFGSLLTLCPSPLALAPTPLSLSPLFPVPNAVSLLVSLTLDAAKELLLGLNAAVLGNRLLLNTGAPFSSSELVLPTTSGPSRLLGR
jgi:hypothetical protein